MGGWAEPSLGRHSFLTPCFFPLFLTPAGKFLLRMPRGMAPKESFVTCRIYPAIIKGKRTMLHLSAYSLPSSCGILAFARVTVYFRIW